MGNTMNNSLMVFEGNEVEIFEFEGKILFNPYHVGECLDLTDSAVRKAIGNMNEKQVIKLTNSIVKDNHFRKLHNTGENFLTESGVYKLIFRSNKEEAEKFQDWVADEVLPSIRQNGMYATDNLLDDPDLLLKTVTKLTVERRARVQAEKEKLRLQAVIEEQAPKVTYYNNVLDKKDLMPTTDVAKKLGLRSAQQLNDYLQEKGIIYPVRVNKFNKKSREWSMITVRWRVTAKYAYITPEYADYHVTKTHKQSLMWTEKGREWIFDMVNVSMRER